MLRDIIYFSDLPDGDLILLLNGLRSPINLGMILRVAETYKVGVALVGSASVIDDEHQLRIVSDFACGAFQRKSFVWAATIDDMLTRLSARRLVSTTVETGAASLSDFGFKHGDTVLLGNEYDGLPEDILSKCTLSIRIPMADVWAPKPPSFEPIDPSRTQGVARDGTPSLNVAMAAGIICYEWFMRTGGADPGEREADR